MAADPVQLYKANVNQVNVGGLAVTAIFGGVLGGILTNPATAADQNIPNVEILFYSLFGDAGISESGTTFALEPGQSFVIPANTTTNLSVNALTAGHRFSAFFYQSPPVYPPDPVPGTFPPDGPISLLKTIPSYLYWEYQDDDDLLAFVSSYNAIMQEYVDWFNQIQLPVYTNDLIAGSLLDWVAYGLYGMKRPVLALNTNSDIGPYNTGMFNEVGWNLDQKVGPSNITVTTDDTFKRIMTWNLYRGDGNTFNLFWLKRRIARFLAGANGAAPAIDNTYGISAAYASRYEIDITLPSDPNATVLKEAIESNVVALPFQISFSVTIG